MSSPTPLSPPSPTLFWLVPLAFVLIIILISLYIHSIVNVRNESEYRDVVEYQTTLVGNLLLLQPTLLPSLGRIRYFPDQSGFFVVIDYEGKILANGDPASASAQSFPVQDIIQLAKNGGGYLRHNYRGELYQTFVYANPQSPYIVCSGLFVDSSQMNRRTKWRRTTKMMCKTASSNIQQKKSFK